MLDLDVVFKQLEDTYSNSKKLPNKIFRCQRDVNGRPLSVFYFDFSGNLPVDDELTFYQDQLLGEDYFSHNGPLQWNYYLTFVTESEKVDEATRRKIEEDVKYSRKFVISDSEFDDFLKFKIVQKTRMADASEDLLARWMNALDKANLGGVYSEDSRAKVLKCYIEGEPWTNESKKGIDDPNIQTMLPAITKLELKSYRPFPSLKAFEFGNVNLFYGPNGVGKTSLFEAIELFYCGKTGRNSTFDESAYEIEVHLKGEITPRSTLDSKPNSFYPDANLKWYKKHVSRGNTLFESFNQFNFYNSDAAFTLAHDEVDRGITEALASLALGEEANRVSGRIESFCEDFLREKASWEKKVERLSKEIKLAEEFSNEVSSKRLEQPEEILQLANVELEKLGWRKVDSKKEGEFEQVINQVRAAISMLKLINGKLDWIDNLTISKIEGEFLRYSRMQKLVSERDSASLIKDGLIGAAESRIVVLRSEEDVLKKLNKFVDAGFEEVILSLKRQEAQFGGSHKAHSILGGIDNKGLSKLDQMKSIEVQLKEVTNELAQIEKASQVFETKLNETAGKIEEIGQILSSIRTLGREYVKLSPDVVKCPICNSKFKKGDLKKHLEAESGVRGEEKDDTKSLQAEVLKLEGRKKKAMAIGKILEKLDEQINLLGKEGVKGISVKMTPEKVLEFVGETYKVLTIELEKRTNWLAVVDKLEDEGLNEEDFENIKERVSKSKKQVKEGDKFSRKKIETLIGELQLEMAQMRQKIEVLREEKNGIEIKFKQDVEKLELSSTTVKVAEGNLRLVSLADVKGKILEFEKLAGSFDGRNLRQSLDQFISCESWLEKYSSLLTIKELEISESLERKKSLEANKTEYEQVSLRSKRATDAFAVLTNLKEKDSKELAVKGFIETNKVAINEVFSRIHSPREFRSIEFVTGEKGGFLLKRKIDDELVSLSQISTGQRSALALSIFITLNLKLTSAPPVVLIDDPVAHVDDLNILSFLDYLREISLVGGRQIFFATASKKLANLFEMKFAPLGNDQFKRYKLERA